MPRVGFGLLVLAATITAAGRSVAGDVGVGVKAGASRTGADVSGPEAFDTQARSELALGASVSIRLGPRVTLEPELLYTELGFSSDDFEVEAAVESRVLLLPLTLKAHLGREGAIRPHLAAGPQLAFIGRTRETFGGVVEDTSDEVRDLDVQLAVGGGLELPAGKGRVSIELRHAWGLRNLDEADEDVVKVRTLLLLVGYRF